MTCRELVDVIDDHLSDELPRAERARFARHLADCETCRRYRNSYEASVELARTALRDSSAEDLSDELVQAILRARRGARSPRLQWQ